MIPTGCRSWAGRADLENQRGEVIDNLEKVGPGHYRTTKPVPVWGTWKTLLRVHDGDIVEPRCRSILAGDPGIGAKEVPAEASMTRPFVQEITILQRERNPDDPKPAVAGRLPGRAVLHADPDRRPHLGRGPDQQRTSATGAEAELQPSAQA